MAGNPQAQPQPVLQPRPDVLPAWALNVSPAATGSLSGGLDVGLEDRRGQIREEWSEEATNAVIDLWGEKHLSINRGKLKKHEWDEVAEKVSQRLGGGKSIKTWLQCKNKIDSVKKKYKIVLNQKASGTAKKEWRLFEKVHDLLGGARADGNGGFGGDDSDDDDMEDGMEGSILRQAQQPVLALPVQDPQRTPTGQPIHGQGGLLQTKGNLKKRKEPPNPFRELALAIREFGARYEKVEMTRQEKMLEMERMRMAFTKELEMQRMQVQLEIAKLTSGKQVQQEHPSGGTSFTDPPPPSADGFAGGVSGP